MTDAEKIAVCEKFIKALVECDYDTSLEIAKSGVLDEALKDDRE